MCGIGGYAGDHRPELLERMCDVMLHRGPDDAGIWHDAESEVGLAHRRLSIIDLSAAGHQPMSNADGTVWITYNGELYNFQEHRKRLQAKGYPFRSQTDTEVLIYLYEELGEDFLEVLNGMFALAIWDSRRQRLLLARDHAGIKPLYYWQDGRRLYFASEIKALVQAPEVKRELDLDCIPDFLTFLWVPGSRTMLKGIRKLEPGHSLVWEQGRSRVKQWFWLEYQADESVHEAEWKERVESTFMRTTQRQMVSDVPLGAYLSGGVDSSSIVACMRRSFPSREIKAYNVRFLADDMKRESFVDDHPFAAKVADQLGIHLESFVMRSDAIQLLPKMIYHLDEPDADPAVFPSYWIAKRAREDGSTVLLSGTGGDEVFFGYRSHRAYRLYEQMRLLPSSLTVPALSLAEMASAAALGAQGPLARRLRKFRRGLAEVGLERHIAIADWSEQRVRRNIYSRDLGDFLEGGDPIPPCMYKYYDSFRGEGELNRHSHLLIQSFLSAHNFLYSDKTSMATSVEMRVPFMDVELMKLAAQIPEHFKLHRRDSKYILKRAMETSLPREVLERSKVGFGAPLRKWIADDLGPVIHDALRPEQIRARGLFEVAPIQEILRENRENRVDHTYLIYSLLNLEVWMRTFIDRAAEEVSF